MKKTTYYAIGLFAVTLVYIIFAMLFTAYSDARPQTYVSLNDTISKDFKPFKEIVAVSDSALLDSLGINFIVKVAMSGRADARPYAVYPKDLVEFVQQDSKLICRLSEKGRKALADGTKLKHNLSDNKTTDSLQVNVYVDESFAGITTDPRHEFVLCGVGLESLYFHSICRDFGLSLTDSCSIGKLKIDHNRVKGDKSYTILGALSADSCVTIRELTVTLHDTELTLSGCVCNVGTLYLIGEGEVNGIYPEKYGHICLRPKIGGTIKTNILADSDLDIK